MKKSAQEIIRRTCGRGTDPNKPMPNQNDVLYGSVGSDLIYTGGSGTGPNENWIFANQSSYNDTTFVTGKAANDAEWRYCHVA